MTWKSYFKAIAVLALPVAIQNLLFTTATMVDTIMIGSQGETAVAAVGLCSQISSLYIQLYWGFISAAIIFFAQYWGAEDEEGMNSIFGILLLIMAVIGLAFGALCIISPQFLLSIYTDKQLLVEIGRPYLRIVGFAFILQVFSLQFSSFLRSTERVNGPLFISILTTAINCLVNWLLIYGRYGLPCLGVTGAAVGTLVSQILNAGMLAIMVFRSDFSIRLRLSKLFVFPKSLLLEYGKKALPVVANEGLYGIGQMLINVSIGRQEETAIAAMAAFRVCEGFVMAFFYGLSSATGVMVGKEIGAGRLKEGHDLAKRSTLVAPIITFGIILLLFLCSHPLYRLFSLGEAAAGYGRYMLLIYLLFGSLRTCNYIMTETTRAGGEPVFATIVELGGLFLIAVPLTCLAGMVWHFPFLIVFICLYGDEILRFPILWGYLKSGKWIRPVTDQGKEALGPFLRSLRGEEHPKEGNK